MRNVSIHTEDNPNGVVCMDSIWVLMTLAYSFIHVKINNILSVLSRVNRIQEDCLYFISKVIAPKWQTYHLAKTLRPLNAFKRCTFKIQILLHTAG